MAQLAFQLYSKQNAGASDKLLMDLVEKSKKATSENEKVNLLLFTVRCLQFITPRPDTRRIITNACIVLIIEWGSRKMDEGISQETRIDLPIEDETAPGYILDNFDNLVNENCETIANELLNLLPHYISEGNDNQAIIALEIALYIEDMHPNFEKVLNKIITIYPSRIEQLYPKSLLLCQSQVWTNKLDLHRLVELHGAKSLFTGSHFIIRDNIGLASTYNVLGNWRNVHENQKMLRDIGDILIAYKPPWFDHPTSLSGPSDLSRIPMSFSKHLRQLDSSALFGLFCLFAVDEEVYSTSINFRSQKTHPFYHLLNVRIYPEINLSGDIQRLLDQCRFSQQQQDFIWRWIRKEISLVAPDKTDQGDNQEQ